MQWRERARQRAATRLQVQAEAAEFVRAAYRALLDREADPEGLKAWVAFLRDGGDVDEMIERIGRSEEFRWRNQVRSLLPGSAPALVAKLEEVGRRPEEERRLAILGNCQARQMASAVQAMTSLPRPFALFADPRLWPELSSGALDLSGLFHTHETIWVQDELWRIIGKNYEAFRDKVMLFPPIRFAGFHPDLVYVVSGDPPRVIDGPTEGYHSSLGLLAWKAGLTPAQACDLFRDDVLFDRLALDAWWWMSAVSLFEAGKRCGIDIGPMFDAWVRTGCFMHTINHPKIHVIADIGRALLARMPDVRLRPGRPERFAHDYFTSSVIWPVYPGVARRLGLGEGSYEFRLGHGEFLADVPVEVIGLEELLERSFETLSDEVMDSVKFDFMEWPRYKALYEELRGTQAP